MAANQLTIDKTIDVSKNSPPEFSFTICPLARFGSISTSANIWSFVAQIGYEIVHMSAAPSAIAMGTLKVDVLVDGVSIMSTPATATVALTPIAGVFSTTRIPEDSTVTVQTTSDSSPVTDVLGQLILRPLLGLVERNAA